MITIDALLAELETQVHEASAKVQKLHDDVRPSAVFEAAYAMHAVIATQGKMLQELTGVVKGIAAMQSTKIAGEQ